MDLEGLIAAAQSAVSAIIQKPKMTEKLLSKPPFRFLHDTISAITVATGFGEGLYGEAELDSQQIADKDAKMAYLQKIFNLVGICKGSALKVSALKVVAGAEPENTNAFLIALAEVATDSNIDSAEAVKRCLGGEEPGRGPIPRRKAGGPAPIADAKPTSDERVPAKSSAKEIEQPADVNPDRGRSRGGTRGGKPAQASADNGLGRPVAVSLDKEIEKCDGSEATTQAMLGELITRPKLTDKLLSKPPFRFLFDIVMEVIKATGFAKFLYSEEEMNSANITEKQQKLLFLDKIIKLVGYQLNTIVVAQPLKIIAGQDAENTNIFLQQLAVAAKLAPDASAAVKTVIEELGGGSPQDLAASVTAKKEALRVEEDRPKKSSRPTLAEPKEEANIPQPKESPTSGEEKGQGLEDNEIKKSARPSTARRAPPKVKESATEVGAKDSVPSSKKTEGILIDGQGDDDDDDLVADDKRLADDFRGTGRGDVANVQSKLVSNILSIQAEQEAAFRAAAGGNDIAEDKATDDGKAGGIRLRGGIRKPGSEKKAVPGSSPTAGQPVTSLAESDIERIRSAVQVLVQNTGPLGSCMDFIQEDVGLMTTELHKWEDECRRDEAQLAAEKLKTNEMLQPLLSELSELEDQIKDQMAKIASLKSSIAKNDDSIQKVLKLVASA